MTELLLQRERVGQGDMDRETNSNFKNEKKKKPQKLTKRMEAKALQTI